MRSKLIGTVIAREWRTRVVKRSFLLGTLLLPLVAVGFMAATVLLTRSAEVHNVVLVEDGPGLISRPDAVSGQHVPRCPGCFPERENLEYRFTREAPPDSVWQREGHTVLVEFDESVLQNRSGYLVYTLSPGSAAKRNIERDLSRAMEHARVLGSTELDWEAYQRLKFEINLIERESGEGGRTRGGGDEIRGLIGFMFSALLFLVLAVYGGLIMRSVVEEKSNRVVEVLIAAVKPEELLLGKVIGMGCVAVTQLLAWTFLSTLSFGAFQWLFDTGLVGNPVLAGGGGVPVDLLTAMAENELTAVLLEINWGLMAGATVAFFIGGYFLYGSIYAAVGASVQSDQEGQSMILPIIMPLFFSYFAATMAMENPDLPLLGWLGWLPLTSPVIMLVRVAGGVAIWEVVLSWLLLMLTARLVLGLAGRAYRFGILHDGSRSGWKLLWQWMSGHGR